MINHYLQKTFLSKTQIIILTSTNQVFERMKIFIVNSKQNFQVSNKKSSGIVIGMIHVNLIIFIKTHHFAVFQVYIKKFI